MAVIEQEILENPCYEIANPDESASVRILRTVRDKFASGDWNWIQRCAWDLENGYCVGGAIKRASQDPDDEEWTDISRAAFHRVERLVAPDDVVSWNDSPDRALPEVLDLLNAAIGDEP